MKRLFNIPLMPIMIIAALASVLAVSAEAQTSSTQRVIANIPFAFSAGKTTLPAGRYTITVLNPSSDRKILQIRSVNGRSVAVVLTTGIIRNASDKSKVIFERYGDRYVFAQAQLAGDTTSLAAVRHKERGEKNAMAKANKKSLVVIVAE
jgi:hypothetical protein